MSKYGDADELQNRRGVTYLYSNGGEVMYCSIRDGECPRPGPGFPWFWRCACRGARCCFGGGGRGGDAVLAVALPAPRNRMVDHVALHHEEALRSLRVRTRVEAEVEATTIPGGGDDDSTRQFRGLLFLSAELDLASNGPGRSWRAGI